LRNNYLTAISRFFAIAIDMTLLTATKTNCGFWTFLGNVTSFAAMEANDACTPFLLRFGAITDPVTLFLAFKTFATVVAWTIGGHVSCLLTSITASLFCLWAISSEVTSAIAFEAIFTTEFFICALPSKMPRTIAFITNSLLSHFLLSLEKLGIFEKSLNLFYLNLFFFFFFDFKNFG